MGVKTIVLILLVSINFVAKGQDKELLKQYVYNQFDVLPSMEINYESGDFLLNPKTKTDEVSLKRIEELTDSFKISDDISYIERIGNIYLRLNKIDSGMHYLREAALQYQEKLNDNPNDIKLLQNLCTVHVGLGELYPAIEFADRIIDINPLDSFAIFTNSFLHYTLGDFPSAKNYCEKFIKYFPENPYAYLLKTMIFFTSEQVTMHEKNIWEGFESDFSFLQEASDTYNNNPQIQLATLSCKLLILYMEIMMPYFYNPPKSLKKFKFQLTKSDSLELALYKNQYLNMIEKQEYKNHYILYYSLGIINFLKGNYSRAIDYFQKSIDLRRLAYREEANVLGGYNNIITCYLYMGDTLKAKKWTKMKIKNKVSYKDMPYSYVELARYDLVKGHLHKGEKLLNKAVALDSTTHEAYVELANIEMINNNLKLAEKYLDKCYAIDSDYKELHESFIILCLFQGDFRTAKFFVNKLLKNDPENSFAQDVKRDFLQ